MSVQDLNLVSASLSNTVIALSYCSIFALLIVLTRQRKDVAFRVGHGLFMLFILACAITYIIRLYVFLQGSQIFAVVIRSLTALITVTTAVMLWRLLPRMLGLPSAVQLRQINEALRHEMAERRKAESALLQSQKMEAVGRISGGLAHDFNNILQVVSGNSVLIAQKSRSDPDIVALAEATQAAAERGVRLTGQLMSFSQEQSVLLDMLNIREYFAAIPARLTELLPARISLEVEGGDIDGYVLADAMQLQLAILNIVTNSREAMPDGGLLRISLSGYQACGRTDLPNGDYLQIRVTDSGLGMTPAVAARAFDPFYSTKPAGMASGLGLSMVYAMAQQSGGTATLTSRLGEGTTVTLYLKQVPADAEADAETADTAIGHIAGSRILLVDDEAATRSVVAMTLESLDCHVTPAAGGAEALTLAESAPPDLFLLDYAMPGMTGAELAARLRARDPAARCIFLTGFADFSAIRAAVGADAVILQKPASRARLAKALASALARDMPGATVKETPPPI